MRLQTLREGIKSVEACIITHTHADHIMGMDDLRSFCREGSDKQVPVYTAPPYQEDIKRVFAYAFEPSIPGVWVPRFNLRDVEPVLELAGLTIQTFWVDHGPTKVLGLRCNDFAYLTDVNNIPGEARAKLSGLDTLVMDAVRRRPHPNHFHLEKAIEVAQEIGARQTYFTHLSDDYDHEATNQELPSVIQLSYDGLRIPL
jgi:phosphoribosyl 1,2-cyclic phosphate phosphodiesterase